MFKHIIGSINDVRIKKKILLIFIFVILLPIVILVMFFSYQIQTELTNREATLAESELTRMQLNINTMFDTASNLAATYFTDKELAWALETYSKSSQDSLTTIRKIDTQVLSNQMIHPFIKQMNIYFDNKNLFETAYSHYLNSDIKQSAWFKDFIASKQSHYIYVSNQDNSSEISFIRKLNSLPEESNNLIKIDILPDRLRSLLDSEVLDKDRSKVYLVDKNNQIVVSSVSVYPIMIDSVKINKHNSVYRKAFADDSLLKGWQIVVISDRSILYTTLNSELAFLVITFMIIMLISMLLFYGLAHSLIDRLEYIARVMEQSKNDELTEIDIDMGADEIGITAKRYNSMIKQVRNLMEENLKANDELQSTNEELLASIEEIENKERQIDELIYTDKLTDLANRFAITHFIDNQIREMNGTENFSIGFLDIDNFKLINDTYGHDIGDEIIKQTGLRLKCFECDSIHIGRFGGDEFIVTVYNFTDLNHLKSIHEAIRIAIKETIVVNNISFLLTISIGISLYGIHSKRRHELIKLADIALYKAKELGRDQIVLFETSMNQALSEKLHRQACIREAIKTNEFELYYQPYYDSKTLTLKGCEALLRWKHSCDLQMSPQEVVQFIEEMGLMVEFGVWIINEACSFAKKLNENRKFPLVVSINISAVQLMQNDFVDRVLKIIESNQVNINHISLEMTESILMYSIEKASSMIDKLRSAGISISLDDFGTGYSSLKYFKELPISTLKIDKSFIDNIATNEYDEQLVDTMIQLAHNKKIDVIAEGVETQIQLNRLNNLGCDMIQGYLLSKPVNESDMLQKSSQANNA